MVYRVSLYQCFTRTAARAVALGTNTKAKEEAYPISVTSSFIVVTPLGFKPKTFRTGI